MGPVGPATSPPPTSDVYIYIYNVIYIYIYIYIYIKWVQGGSSETPQSSYPTLVGLVGNISIGTDKYISIAIVMKQ